MKKIYHHTLFLVIFLKSFVAFSAQVNGSMAKKGAFNFIKAVDRRVNSSSYASVLVTMPEDWK